jgi:MoxR-like ATPase
MTSLFKKHTAKPAQSAPAEPVKRYLPALGVYGFDAVEPAILASLVTEDPLLLIGKSGTGKTYLLNSLSEVLALEHRHYNASLISFDDLVGFPYPEPDGSAVRFLETPATVWPAQSVLIDEISRCKPEHQNRLFALIHERRIQGIALDKLRFRWAAMNPPSIDQGSDDDYIGSEPLDPALADRFSLFVTATDWDRLDEEQRRAIARPSGEGRIAYDGGVLAGALSDWRASFCARIDHCPELILDYVTSVANNLLLAGVRISPRRVRLIARSLLAAEIVIGAVSERVFLTILQCSLPHQTYGHTPDKAIVLAAHRAAWDAANSSEQAWVHAFLAEPRIAGKFQILIDKCPSPDAGSQAVAQLLAQERPDRAAAFAFAAYPAASAGHLPIGSEGVNDLARLASAILEVDGEITWAQPAGATAEQPEELTRIARVLSTIGGARLSRARQFFYHCLVARIEIKNPAALEVDIDDAVSLLRTRVLP